MRLVLRYGLALVGAIALFSGRAEAASYTFSYCFDNNSGMCGTIAAQMTVDVTNAGTINGAQYADFKFINAVTATSASSVTDIYFDAGGFLKNLSVHNQTTDTGVNFKAGAAKPWDPPGGNNANPVFEVSSRAGARDPQPDNALNSADDYLTLRLQLASGKTFDDIINALDLGPDSGAGIRIAAHVQAIGSNEQSDTFICCGGGGTPTPEPGSLALFGLAALGAAYRVRRRSGTAVS